ncbi:MAG: hypothetical protein Q4B99_00740 [Clostridia bacterium]|nr:hypothetical protein [Clostridia bacterium]
MSDYNWFRLDNAAKIYPVIQTERWSPIFRMTAIMKEPVSRELLQRALDSLSERFPSFYVRIRTGMFWYYLERLSAAPRVEDDVINPCGAMTKGEPLFRVRCHENRISLEMHHVVTDGTGGLTFFKTLLAQYLRMAGHDIPCDRGVLDPTDRPDDEELEDAFMRFSEMKILPPRMEQRAYKIRGTRLPMDFMRITTGTMRASEVHAAAKRHGATVTEFLTALLLQCVYKIQLADGHPQRPVKVSVPVNLRRYYGTRTLRNFSQYLNPGIDPQYGEFTFEEILSQVHHYMRLMYTEKNLNARISKNVADEKNVVLRFVPLFVKNAAIFFEWSRIGENLFSTTLSNMGVVDMPDELAQHIERMDFALHTARRNKCECAVLTFGDTMSLSFSSTISERYLERLFFTALVKNSIHVLVESNEL